MTTTKQLAANRLNAKKSTGPRSASGKQRMRQNAYKHGLTAETVVAVLEDADEYAALERSLVAERQPTTLAEHMLVVRLASLLWRLRRATAIETGLFEAQSRTIKARRLSKIKETEQAQTNSILQSSPSLAPGWSGETGSADVLTRQNSDQTQNCTSPGSQWFPNISECFFRLATEQGDILERIDRYEAGLWKQVGQMLLILRSHEK